jgi:hypothetical protein
MGRAASRGVSVRRPATGGQLVLHLNLYKCMETAPLVCGILFCLQRRRPTDCRMGTRRGRVASSQGCRAEGVTTCADLLPSAIDYGIGMLDLDLLPHSLAAQEALQEGLTDELVEMAAAMKARALQTQVRMTDAMHPVASMLLSVHAGFLPWLNNGSCKGGELRWGSRTCKVCWPMNQWLPCGFLQRQGCHKR